MTDDRPAFRSTTRFADFEGVPPCVLSALQNTFGYEHASTTQAMYLQAGINGQDLFVKTRTGSGKTIGFLLPLFTRLMSEKTDGGGGVRALVLSPTRELAQQTAAEATKLGAECRVAVVTFIGGTSKAGDARSLAALKSRASAGNGIIVVATPGRLEDHLKTTQGFAASLAGCRVLVLDEADRLLEPSFASATYRIADATAKRVQTLMFTATVPPGVKEGARRLLRRDDAYQEFVEGSNSNSQGNAGAAHNPNVVQTAMLVPASELMRTLVAVHAKTRGKTIVFVQTKRVVPVVLRLLQAANPKRAVLQIQSDMTQGQRTGAIRDFAAAPGDATIIATDVFARGIDVRNVSTVIQLGIAADAAQVAHRSGRTGRGGATGEAVIILATDEKKVLDSLIQKDGMPIRVVDAPKPAQLPAPAANAGVQNCKAFIAAYGFYKSQTKRLGWKAADLLPRVFERFRPLGISAPSVCALPEKTMKKIGISKDQWFGFK
jgi:ATP-dependent RNA helicase RhlE